MTTLIVAALAACCVMVATSAADGSLSRLGAVAGGGAVDSRRGSPRLLLVLTATGVLLLALWSGAAWRLALVVVASLGALAFARRVARLWQLRRLRRARQLATIAVCDALAAELRAGLPALTALRRSCESSPELASVATAARLDADIPAALRATAASPGAEGLRALAAAWEVAASSGAALAAVLERVAASLRSEEEARAEVMAALGPPRSTAKMLAALPLAGLAMGESMGSAPVAFLLGTSWGLACLAGGVVLALAGVWWVELLASAAER